LIPVAEWSKPQQANRTIAARLRDLGLDSSGLLFCAPGAAEDEVRANCDAISRFSQPVDWRTLVGALDKVFQAPGEIGDAVDQIRPEPLQTAVWLTIQYATDTGRTLGAFADLGRKNPLWIAALHSMERTQLLTRVGKQNVFADPERPPTTLGTDDLSTQRATKLRAALNAADLQLSCDVIALDVPYRLLFPDEPLNPSNFVIYDGSRRSASISRLLWDDLDPTRPQDLSFMVLLLRSVARSESLYTLMDSALQDSSKSWDPAKTELLQAVVEELRILNRGFMKREWDEALEADVLLQQRVREFIACDDQRIAGPDTAEIEQLPEKVRRLCSINEADVDSRSVAMGLFKEIGRVVMMLERRGHRSTAIIAFDQSIEAIVAAQKADLAGIAQSTLQIVKIYTLLFHEQPGRFLVSLRHLLDAPFTQSDPHHLGFPHMLADEARRLLRFNLCFGSLKSLEQVCMNVLRSRMWGGNPAVRSESARVIASAVNAFRLFERRTGLMDRAERLVSELTNAESVDAPALVVRLEGNSVDRFHVDFVSAPLDTRIVRCECRVGTGHDVVSVISPGGPQLRAPKELRDRVVNVGRALAREYAMQFRNLV
jgi:hypothetical protein